MKCPAIGKECEGGCENPEDCLINRLVESGAKQANELIQNISIEAINDPSLQYMGTENRLKMADKIASLIKNNLQKTHFL